MEIRELIHRSTHILITSHVSLDGDALGSSLALGSAIRKMGKKTTVAFSDPIPNMFRFLPGWEEARGPDADLQGVDLVFALDLGDLDRVGSLFDKQLFANVPIINIDHHPTNSHFGTVNIVDAEAPATCELVWEVIKSLDVPIDKEMAACLLTGLITDTLGFRVPTTRTSTLRLAADLTAYDVSISAIADAVFNSKPYSAIRLLGLALAQLQRQDRIVWTTVTKAMLVESGATSEDCEAIVNLLASVRDADASIVFKEQEDGTTRVSMRTNERLNAGQICQRFGGGGHLRAAGCGVKAGLQATQHSILAYIGDALSSSQA